MFRENVRHSFYFNSLPTSDNTCYLLIALANSFDHDQAPQNVGPDLHPSCLTLMVLLKAFFESHL